VLTVVLGLGGALSYALSDFFARRVTRGGASVVATLTWGLPHRCGGDKTTGHNRLGPHRAIRLRRDSRPVVNRERSRPIQRAGVVCTILAVTILALG
jgi:hypothetical protein